MYDVVEQTVIYDDRAMQFSNDV